MGRKKDPGTQPQGVEVAVAMMTENEQSDYHGTDLRGKDLRRANLRDAKLSEARLTGADLGGANLRDADLSGADLRQASLRGTKLYETDLTHANLSGTNLFEADLSGANLTRANLYRISLRGAILRGTNLIEADLREADLNGADLYGANLSGARFGRTVLGDIDLSGTKGLVEVQHESMSTIGTDTIQRSKGKIPEKFLRGCGLSDLDIEYAKLAAPGFNPEQVTRITDRIHELFLAIGNQYFSCFISYSSKDGEFARSLHDDLQNNGVRCWFAPEDLEIGDKFHGRIDDAIRIHDKLLIVLSENSIKSFWVEKEVETAFEKESKCGCIVFFPIRLDDGVMNTAQVWAADILSTRHIGDFSMWKDQESYQKAFERLLRDLKTAGNEA